MAAEPDTRDYNIACQISECEDEVWRLNQVMCDLTDEARRSDAHGHAEQYESISASLACAAKNLGRAHSKMLRFEVDG